MLTNGVRRRLVSAAMAVVWSATAQAQQPSQPVTPGLPGTPENRGTAGTSAPPPPIPASRDKLTTTPAEKPLTPPQQPTSPQR